VEKEKQIEKREEDGKVPNGGGGEEEKSKSST